MGLIRASLVNAALSISTILLLLVGLDVLAYISPLRVSVLQPHEPQGYLQFDSELGYDIAPNQPPRTIAFADASFEVWSNSNGCFDEEFDTTAPYIYLTGDSFAWGWAPFEDKWGKQIEHITNTRVLTCGVNGYGTRQEYIKTARQLTELPVPKVIIVGYLGANDIDDDLLFPNHVVYDGYPVRSDITCSDATCTVPTPTHSTSKSVKAWLATHSVLYTLIQRHVYAPLRSAVASAPPVRVVEQRDILPAVHTQAMLGFQQLAQEKGATLLVVLIPSKEDVRTEGVYHNALMKTFLDEHNISYVDLLPAFKQEEQLPDKPLYWTHDGHWNSAGNVLAGNIVADYLVSHHLMTQ